MGGSNIGGSATEIQSQIGEGNRRNLVKYESPTIAGFVVSGSWGEDDFWDVAARYAGEFSGIRIALGIGYESFSEGPQAALLATANNERNCAIPLRAAQNDIDCQQLGLSGSIMHMPTGLYLHGAYGVRKDHNSKLLWGQDADETSTQYYVQAGIEKNWFGYGATTLFGEYQNWDIGATNKWFKADMSMWGIGINQRIENASMDLYLNYRNYSDIGAITFFCRAIYRIQGCSVSNGWRNYPVLIGSNDRRLKLRHGRSHKFMSQPG